MSSLVSTNIRLSKDKLKALKLKAVEEGKSLSQLIREAVDKILLPSEEKISEEEFRRDSFFKIVGMFESGIKNGSINHDKYIYPVR